MKSSTARTVFKFFAVTAVILGLYALLMLGFVTVMNADLYGRLIETKIASGVGNAGYTGAKPRVRLILHKLLSDENAVEASLMLIVEEGELPALVRDNKLILRAEVRDGSSFQPYGILSDVTLDMTSAKAEAGVNSFAVQSQRFLLPALPSAWGFPFDDLQIRPIVDLRRDGLYTARYRLEIQKALPGRTIEVSNGTIAEINLTRTPTEKGIVLVSSFVFLFLSSILIFVMFKEGRGLTGLQELLAVGGYLVAAAGFREVLGVSRTAGVSTLEIMVIGLPLLLLGITVGVSFLRGRLEVYRSKHGRSS